jgi:MFS family permease
MTSTPVEMMLCGFGVGASATVIQAHAVAMFGPGFFTGRLIARFGAPRVATAGAVLSALCVLVGLQGQGFWHFAVALALLGVGWNFMFVSATTMLSTAHEATERVRAQSANDLLVFGTVACTAFLSGFVHAGGGWAALNLSLLPPLAGAAAPPRPPHRWRAWTPHAVWANIPKCFSRPTQSPVPPQLLGTGFCPKATRAGFAPRRGRR